MVLYKIDRRGGGPKIVYKDRPGFGVPISDKKVNLTN